MNLYKASIEKRASAFCIDTFLVTVLILCDMALSFISENYIYGEIIQVCIAVLIIIFGYFGFLFIWDGQTLGKKIMHIKDVSIDGNDAPMITILIREFIKVSLSIVTVGVYPIVCGLLYIIKKDGTYAIHDILCKTYVKDFDLKEILETRKDEGFRDDVANKDLFKPTEDALSVLKQEVEIEEKK